MSSKTASPASPAPTCSICKEEISSKIYNYIKTACNHEFHLNCLTDWYQSGSDPQSNLHEQSMTCPNCREILGIGFWVQVVRKNEQDPKSPEEEFDQIATEYNLSKKKLNDKKEGVRKLKELMNKEEYKGMDENRKKRIERFISEHDNTGGNKRRKQIRRKTKKKKIKKKRKKTIKKKRKKRRKKKKTKRSKRGVRGKSFPQK